MSATVRDGGASTILRDRARRLARPLSDSTASPHAIEAMTFSVGRERYALEARYVVAVARLLDLVPLPGAVAPVLGVARWRGEVLTIVDVRRLVGESALSLDDLGIIIVVGLSEAAFGILADEAMYLGPIEPDALHLPTTDRLANTGSVIRGATSEGVQLLDAAKLIGRQAGAQTKSSTRDLDPSPNPARSSEPNPTRNIP